MFGGRFSSSIGVVGVDFSSSAVKLLQVREHQRDLHVVGCAQIGVPRRDDGSIDGDALETRLGNAIARGGFTGRRCVVSLPRETVRIQAVRLPSMPDAELRDAVAWEAAERFDLDRESIEVDFVRTGATLNSGESREEVILVAATHTTLRNYLDPIIGAGLRPLAVDVSFAAIARALSRQHRREADRGNVRAVVEVGATGSYVLILRGDQIAFCKTMPIGGHRFDEAVQEHLQLDPNAARQLRADRLGGAASGPRTADSESTERAVFEAVRPLLGELVKEVLLCLRYYGVTFRGQPPSRIILAGGDSLEPHFDRMLAEACKLPVAFDDDRGTYAMLGEELIGARGGPASRWITAVGLSSRRLDGAAQEEGDRRGGAQKGAAA